MLVLSLPVAASAEDTPSTLDEILITATRRPLSTFEAPYTATVIDAADLDRRLVRTVPEALRDVPGVMVQKTSFGQASPFLRGFTGFRTLMLVDGIRLNNSTFREGPNQYWSTIDPLTLERLEVVKGPGSVLYGSDAVGGTVNAITRGPYALDDGRPAGGRLYYRVASAERSHVGHAEVSAAATPRIGVYADASARTYGDLDVGGGSGREDNTGYDEWAAAFKTELALSPDALVVAAHQSLEQHDVPRTHSTIFAEPFHGTSPGSDPERDLDQGRHLSYVQLHAEDVGPLVDTLAASLSWHAQSEEEERTRSTGSRRVQGVEVGTLGSWLQLGSSTPIGELVYGYDYYRDVVNSDSSGNPIQGPVADDAAYDLLGVYLQDDIEIVERWRLLLGGRFTYAAVDANGVADPESGAPIGLDDDWTGAVGNVRLAYDLLPERLNLFAGVSQAFRAPNLSDLSRLDSARSGELETPAPNLDPEHYLSYEAGFKTRLSRASFEATYFYTDIDEMVVLAPTGRLIEAEREVTKRNAGDGFVHGVEAFGQLALAAGLQARAGFTWMDGEVDAFPTSDPIAERAPLSRVMPVTGTVALRWEDVARGLWAEAAGTFAGKQDELAASDVADTQRIPPGGTPGYEVLSLYCGWRLTERVDVTAALENVTDASYRVHGSGTNEAGRSVLLSLDMRL